MREGNNHNLQILGIKAEYTTEDILWDDLKNYVDKYDSGLYVIDEKGHIKSAEDYLEKDIQPEKEIITIYIQYSDEYLSEEISTMGVEDIFSGYDWRPILDNIEIKKQGSRKILDTQKIVCDVILNKSYDHWSGGYEYDSEVIVVGYMKKDLQVVYTNKNYPLKQEMYL